MFTTIFKQNCINTIGLPYDILNKIKSFCFYDIKSWETMSFIKYKKNRIHELFKTSTISRANPYDFFFGNLGVTEEHWVFWTFDEDDGANKQFQGNNCKCCGNYFMVENERYAQNILCVCPDDDNDDNDDDDNDDDNDDNDLGFGYEDPHSNIYEFPNFD
jgi:hypothetical protein